MNFSDAIGACFHKYADFSGRATRSEFWYFVLFCFLTQLGITIILGEELAGLFYLGLICPLLAVSWRRMHDIGRSGLFCLVPIVDIVLECMEGQKFDNRFGPNPYNQQ